MDVEDKHETLPASGPENSQTNLLEIVGADLHKEHLSQAELRDWQSLFGKLRDPQFAPEISAQYTDKPVPRNGSKWRQEHETLVKKAEKSDASLVFYGDSITAGMSIGNALKKTFGNGAENFGIVGDSTQHLLWRLQNGEAHFKKPPEQVVLLIGANNIGAAGRDDIVRGVMANLKELQQKLPDSEILVLGVLPQGRAPSDKRRVLIKEVNAELEKQLNGIGKVKFLDAGPAMLEPDGSMSDRVWWKDGLHPRNYEPLFDAVKNAL